MSEPSETAAEQSASKEERSQVMASILAAIQEHRPILDRFHEESDRGAILVAASFLDSTLERILRASFIREADEKLLKQLFSFEGPLGAFSARINIAFAMGLIHANTAAHMHRIRRIRNDCAHSPETVDFETDSVRDLVASMWPVDSFIPIGVREESRRSLTRARFLTNAVMLYGQLLLTLRDAEATKRQQLWLTHLMGKDVAEAKLERARAEAEASRIRIAELEREIAEGVAEYARSAGITVEEARSSLDAMVDEQNSVMPE